MEDGLGSLIRGPYRGGKIDGDCSRRARATDSLERIDPESDNPAGTGSRVQQGGNKGASGRDVEAHDPLLVLADEPAAQFHVNGLSGCERPLPQAFAIGFDEQGLRGDGRRCEARCQIELEIEA